MNENYEGLAMGEVIDHVIPLPPQRASVNMGVPSLVSMDRRPSRVRRKQHRIRPSLTCILTNREDLHERLIQVGPLFLCNVLIGLFYMTHMEGCCPFSFVCSS